MSADRFCINYGTGVITLPLSLTGRLPNASEAELRVLIAVAADPSADDGQIAVRCGTDLQTVQSALSFWRGAGIILPAEDAKKQAAEEKKKQEILTSSPLYSADEVSGIMEGDASVASMLDEVARLFEKTTLGQTDSVKLVSAMSYFGVNPEYVAILCAHCARIKKKSVGYAVSVMSDLSKKGINTTDLLNEYLLGIEQSGEFSGEIRRMFGISLSRELTDRERSFMETWAGVYKYDIETVRIAYNITVDTIGEPVLAYADAIMAKWYEKQLKTQEEIREFIKAEKAGKAGKGGKKGAPPEGKSFDADEFFRKALEKTYGAGTELPENPAPAPAGADRRNVGKTKF